MSQRSVPGVVFLMVLASWVSVISAFSLVDMPNPMHSPDLCGRQGVPRSVICDPENYLSKDSKDVLEGRIIEIEEKKQLQFGVAVVGTMRVLESQIDREAKRYAESLHTTWGVGDKNSQNGVVIFLAIDDRVVHISTGAGAKEKLTDLVIQSIIGRMRPYLKKGQYGKAIEASVIEMDMVMENKSIAPSFFEKYGSFLFFGGLIGGLLLYDWYKKNEEEKLKRGKKSLEKLMKEVKASEDNKFQFESCPICLEDFSQRRDPTDTEHIRINEDSSLNSSAYVASAQYREVRSMIPGQASSSSSSSDSTSVPSDGKRPMTLQCGHAFCYDCLKEYLSGANRNTVCPVCRAPVDPDTPVATQQPPPRPDNSQYHPQPPGSGDNQSYSNPSCHSSQSNQQSSYHHHGWHRRRSHFHEMELLYRLSRLQRMYPSVVTTESYNNMRTALETGDTPAFVQAAENRTAAVESALADIQKQREAAARGSGGSSRSSFGGGSSRGGGGGGGRW